MRERTAGGLNVALGGRRGAPTLVLVHGIATTWRAWEPLLSRLERRFRIVAVDLPGFGGSAPLPTGEYRLEQVAEHLADALDELKVRKHWLMGHSLGGGVAVVYASLFPERVQRLVLLAPAVAPTFGGLLPHVWRLGLLHEAGRRAAALAIPLLRVSAGARRALFAGLVHDPAALTREAAVSLVTDYSRGLATHHAGIEILAADLTDRAPQLRMPTLVLWGERDNVVPPSYAEAFVQALPDVTSLTLPKAGHLLTFEAPGEILDAIDDFAAGSVRPR